MLVKHIETRPIFEEPKKYMPAMKIKSNLWYFETPGKGFIILLLFVLISLSVYSQPNKRTNFWYFAENIGLDFNSGAPVEDLSCSIYSGHSDASALCDTSGNLLFYSNGKQVWNKNHVRMEGGYAGTSYTPGTQAALSIPKPGSDSLYYIFTSKQYEHNSPMFYYIVDMSANDGLGKVIDKDTLLAGWDAAEQLTAVYKNNKEDYWVITRKYRENKYASFLVNSDGVETEPVLNPAPYKDDYNPRGHMKVSYDKKYLASCFSGGTWIHSGVEICKFNNETGAVDYLYYFRLIDVILGGPAYRTNNCEFSPCSKFMYLAGYLPQDSTAHIYQFDMQYIDDSVLFEQSAIKVGEGQGFNIQLASDGKIYCFAEDAWHSTTENNLVGVINNPEKFGTDCNYEPDVFNLSHGSVVRPLVNFVPDFLYRFDFEGVCESDIFTFDPWFFPEPDLIEWNFGDPVSGTNNTSTIPHATHKFTNGGNYEVSVHVEYPPSPAYPFGRIEETSREVEVSFAPDPILGPDTTICNGTDILLDAECGPHNYSWSTGTFGTSQITVSDTGIYSVSVSSSEGCVGKDTIHIAHHSEAIADTTNLIISPTTCGGSVGVIRGLSINGSAPWSLLWLNDINDPLGSNIDLYHLPVGNYRLEVTDSNGCTTVLGPWSIVDAGDVLVNGVDFNTENCNNNNGSIHITATTGLGDMLEYSIDNGTNYFQNLGVFNGLSSDSYAVMVRDSSSCVGSWIGNPIVIQNTEDPFVNSVQIIPATVGLSNGSININATSAFSDTIKYSNNGGSNFQVNDGQFANLAAGFYNCMVKDKFECDTSFTIELTEIVTEHLEAVAGYDESCPGNSAYVPLTVSSFNDVSSFMATLNYNNEYLICEGYSNAHPDIKDSLQATLFPGEGKVVLNWQGETPLSLMDNSKLTDLVFTTLSQDDQSPVSWDGQPGAGEFTNSTGLSIPVDYSMGQVKIFKKVYYSLNDSVTACEGDSIKLSAMLWSSNGTVTYNWTFPDGSTYQGLLLEIEDAEPNQSGKYLLNVIDIAQCSSKDSVSIIVFPAPSPLFAARDTIFTQEAIELDAGEGYLSYLWNTGTTNRYEWAEQQGWYWAELTSNEGCVGIDSSFVSFSSGGETINIYFSNAFSPNGDGLNDEFKIVTGWGKYLHTFRMEIYNRWGGLVFESNDLSKGWDGKCKGEACPAGSYVLKVVYNSTATTFSINETKMGTVLLVR